MPQFYLRGFAETGQLLAMNKANGDLVLVGVRDAAVKKNAYAPDGLPQNLDPEREIAEQESRWARALLDLCSNFPPSRSTRRMISEFLAFQIARQPSEMDRVGQAMAQAGILDSGLSSKDGGLLGLGILAQGPEEVSNTFFTRRWVMYEARGGTTEFITSDSPVCRSSPPQQLRQHLAEGQTHVKWADTEHFSLPLCRDHMLFIEKDSRGSGADRMLRASIAEMQALNRRTAFSAKRFVFAHPAIHEGWIRGCTRPFTSQAGLDTNRPR